MGHFKNGVFIALFALLPVGWALLLLWLTGYAVESVDELGEALDYLSGFRTQIQGMLFLHTLAMFGCAIILLLLAFRQLWSMFFLGWLLGVKENSPSVVMAPVRAIRRQGARRREPAVAAAAGADQVGEEPRPEEEEVAQEELVRQPPTRARTASPPLVPAGGARFCTACGAPTQPGARFCPSCGQPLPG